VFGVLAVVVGAGLVVVTTSGERPGGPSLQRIGLRTFEVRPGEPFRGSLLRLVPTSSGPCQSGDLVAREQTVAPANDRAGRARAASFVVSSRRACRIGGPRTVTFLAAGGSRQAAPTVVVDGAESDPVVVGPGRSAILAVDFAFEPPCIPPELNGAQPTSSALLELASASLTVDLSRTIGACPMRATLQSDDVYDAEAVSVEFGADGPATVAAGATVRTSVTLTYIGTATAVFDPCPTLWASLQPQSEEPVTSTWELDCQGMRPLGTGDALRVPVPIAVPGSLSPQAVAVRLGFGQTPLTAAVASARTARTLQVEVTAPGVRPLQPVPFADIEPPQSPWALRRTTGPPCQSGDLRPEGLTPTRHNGAGMHGLQFQLRNVSGRPCMLSSNIPVRLGRPGAVAHTLPRGTSLFTPLVNGELAPDAITTVGFQAPNACARGADERVEPYDTVFLELADAALAVPFAIDEPCGVSTTGLGVVAAPELGDTRSAPGPSVFVSAPPVLARGKPAMIEVRLVSGSGYELGCPGYAVTIASSETRRGLNCAVRRLLPGVAVVYEIEVVPPATALPGQTKLRWELLAGRIPSSTVTVTLA
jgi:hypothetical protein